MADKWDEYETQRNDICRICGAYGGGKRGAQGVGGET
jgi:hypothetical protein